MSDPTVLLLAGVLFSGVAVVLLFARRLVTLGQELAKLRATIDSAHRDVANLRVSVNKLGELLAADHQQLARLANRQAEIERRSQESGPYGDAIGKIRRGAGVEEIMREYGLSRDEVSLLLRLRGSQEPQ